MFIMAREHSGQISGNEKISKNINNPIATAVQSKRISRQNLSWPEQALLSFGVDHRRCFYFNFTDAFVSTVMNKYYSQIWLPKENSNMTNTKWIEVSQNRDKLPWTGSTLAWNIFPLSGHIIAFREKWMTSVWYLDNRMVDRFCPYCVTKPDDLVHD